MICSLINCLLFFWESSHHSLLLCSWCRDTLGIFLKHQPGQHGFTFIWPIVNEAWNFNYTSLGWFFCSSTFVSSLFTRIMNMWEYWIADFDEIVLRCFLYLTWWITSCRSIARILTYFGNPCPPWIYVVATMYASSYLWR